MLTHAIIMTTMLTATMPAPALTPPTRDTTSEGGKRTPKTCVEQLQAQIGETAETPTDRVDDATRRGTADTRTNGAAARDRQLQRLQRQIEHRGGGCKANASMG